MAVTFSLGLTKNGSSAAGSPAAAFAGTGWVAYGDESNLWGTTWTPAEVNASTFGCLLTATEGSGGTEEVTLDAIRITVYYTLPDTRPERERSPRPVLRSQTARPA